MMTPRRRACSFSSTEDDCRSSIAESPCRSMGGGTIQRSNHRTESSTWNPFSSQLREKRRLLLQQTPERNSNSNNVTDTDGAINPYRMLQIRKDSTKHEIRQAYRRVALWHHPQRTDTQATISDAERERRERIFTILAACCETLLERESRTRLDALLKGGPASRQQPTSLSLASTKTTMGSHGTTRTTTTSAPATPSASNITTSCNPQSKHLRRPACHEQACADTSMSLPMLSRTFSSYYDDDDDDHDDYHKDKGCRLFACGDTQAAAAAAATSDAVHHHKRRRNPPRRPSLVTSCSTEEMDHVHYTQVETDRLFGGPLSLLYRARLFQTFSDPHEIFDRIFGSSLFPPNHAKSSSQYKNCITPAKQSNSSNSAQPTIKPPLSSNALALAGKDGLPTSSRSSAWTGSHEVLPDGSTVYTTCRVLHHRKLIKREHITIDPLTGKKRSSITVTGEELPDETTEPNNQRGNKATNGRSKGGNDAEFDPGYWSCCSPMLVFGGNGRSGGGRGRARKTQIAPSPERKPIPSGSTTTTSTAATTNHTNNSRPSTCFSRINCAVW